MARTFEQRVESITKIDIGLSSTPTQEELTQFLDEGIKDLTNKVINLRPAESYKFASNSSVDDNSGIEVKGRVLSVVRENGSTADLRSASQISPQLRYLATDSSSLHYRSAYNPAFFLLNTKLYVLPAPSGSNQEAHISHINYRTANYADNTISSFPDEYENLIILFASSMSALSAANDIHNNLPTKPITPNVPNFDIDNVSLPSFPVYSPPELILDFNSIKSNIKKEDFDTAEKYSDLLSKRIDEYAKLHEQENTLFQKDLDIFKADLDTSTKNSDRDAQIAAGEYRSEIYKYQYDIAEYTAELQESLSKYKWFIEQYTALMNEYNQGIVMSIKQKERPSQSSKQQQRQSQQPKEGGE
jgi:hypothetical protein